MIRILFSVFVLILLITSPANSQDDFIWVAGMKLKKGLNKKDVMLKLKVNYRLIKSGDEDEDSWLIVEKGSKYKWTGSVTFREDKLEGRIQA
ncbi:unnamed protein product [marine sediment metagenome]|uniref:Uncharacterized protein n=1 Tax=marine sediment metagenome TaxID=412755 RepID=X1V0X1_9ZZZZ